MLVNIAGPRLFVEAPASGVRKWRPGYYLRPNATAHAADESAVDATADLIETHDPLFKGLNVQVPWWIVEPTTQGSYSFTAIHRILDYLDGLAVTPKPRLLFQFYTHKFGSAETAGGGGTRSFPDYILSGGGVTSLGGTLYAVDLANSTWMDAFIDALTAIGGEFDDHPLFEGVLLNETAHSFSDLWPASIPIIKAAFPKSLCVIQPNFVASTAGGGGTPHQGSVDLCGAIKDAALACGAGLGGPDILLAATGGESMIARHIRGAGVNTDYIEGNYGTDDNRGDVPSVWGWEALRGDTLADVISFALTELQPTHISVGVTESDPDPDINFSTGVLPVVTANPLTVETCPANYAGECE